ncbi:uncharacterized protein METZ01_LOCUS115723, partial [marine metagenome]
PHDASPLFDRFSDMVSEYLADAQRALVRGGER